MRIFYGINLPNQTKSHLFALQEELKSLGVNGKFIPKDNFHITLKFMGESHQEELEDFMMVCQLAGRNMKPFTIQLEKIGYFNRGDSKLLYINLQPNHLLDKLYSRLESNFFKIGYKKDRKKYNPHITIGREIFFPKALDLDGINEKLKKYNFNCNGITIFESVRNQSQLIYRTVYESKFSK